MPGRLGIGTRTGRKLALGALLASTLASLGCQQAGREATEPPSLAAGEIFALTCAHCHTGEALGAPRIGFPEEWNAREARDLDTLLARTISGYRDMPPLGTCGYCSEADLRRVIALMVAGSNVDLGAAEGTP